VTVRVPTHKDGSSLFWEFATDSYDIAFGLFFEWTPTEESEVSVHISDSEDEDINEEEEGDSAIFSLSTSVILLVLSSLNVCLMMFILSNCGQASNPTTYKSVILTACILNRQKMTPSFKMQTT
jgi:hypothetical protein